MNGSSITLNTGNATRPFHLRAETSDKAVFTQIFANRNYDVRKLRRAPELLDLIKHGGGRRPLIVDAGANIGASAVYFAITVPTAHIVAIEPDQDNFRLLSRNVEGLDVESVHGAISSTNGHARVVDPGEGHWGYRTEPVRGSDAGSVPCVIINEIFNSHRSEFFPFIVKLDIEGAEEDVFSGHTQWLEETPLLIIELHDWLLPRRGTSRPFLKRIAELDRDFITIGENIFSMANNLWPSVGGDATAKVKAAATN